MHQPLRESDRHRAFLAVITVHLELSGRNAGGAGRIVPCDQRDPTGNSRSYKAPVGFGVAGGVLPAGVVGFRVRPRPGPNIVSRAVAQKPRQFENVSDTADGS